VLVVVDEVVRRDYNKGLSALCVVLDSIRLLNVEPELEESNSDGSALGSDRPQVNVGTETRVGLAERSNSSQCHPHRLVANAEVRRQ